MSAKSILLTKYFNFYPQGYGAAILLVLFILLVIILGARAFDNNR